jgi:pyruvate/2-oxoglutarate dehydrogenase complex dihydrolipoamide dehydrogenase (E3) component
MDCLLIRRKSRNDKKKKQKKGFDILIASRPMSKIARARKKKGEIKGFMEAIIDAKTNQF